MQSAVYFFEQFESGLCKIGCTSFLKQRIKSLPSGRLLHSIATEDGRSLELAMHSYFHGCQVKNELFKLTQEQIAHIKKISECNGGNVPEWLRPHWDNPRSIWKPRKLRPGVAARIEEMRWVKKWNGAVAFTWEEMKRVALAIKQSRKAGGFPTISTFAREKNVCARFVRSIESGKTIIKFDDLLTVANAIGTTPRAILQMARQISELVEKKSS